MSKYFSLFLAFFFLKNTALTQEVKTVRDIGVWIGVGLNYELNKKWDFGINQELRTFDNSTRLSKSISEIDLNYTINNNFKLRLGGRYSFDRKKNELFTHDIRYNIDVKIKGDRNSFWSWQYRFRYQHSYENLFTFTPDTQEESNVRNRAKVDYTLNAHKLYFSTELFRVFTYFEKPRFNRLRTSIGDEFETKLGDLDVSICHQVELGEEDPLNFFFLNIHYTFNFKK